MARKNREWYPGAKYHIMCRGNHRNDLFRDGEDYEVYLNILKETKKKLMYEIYCYCLMTNHIHMVIETGEISIGNIMKRINMCYSIYFNKKYNLIGHLFQDRYKSELIEEDKYILEVSRYIHLNPIKANMVKKSEEYKWSTYSMYIGEQKEKFINSQKILGYFKKGNQRQLYKRFVENGIKIKMKEDEEVV